MQPYEKQTTNFRNNEAHPIYSNVDNYANAGNEQLDNAEESDNEKIGLKFTS